jgi:hypothetical protein
MTRQVINTGTVANDDTGDSLRSAGQKINQNFGELYNKFGGDSNFISTGVSFDNNNIIFEGTTPDNFETFLTVTNPTADRSVLIPDASGNIVLDTNAVTLTNKELDAPTMSTPSFYDVSETHKYNMEVSELSNDRTITLPLLTGNDTFVFNSHAATLTNKTLTTPTISDPDISGNINDVNGAEIINLSAVVSAVNNVQLSNATTGNAPVVSAVGTNGNIDLGLEAKGTGAVFVRTKMAYFHETKTGGGAVSLTKTYTSLNSGSGQSATIANGTVTGQVKYLTNKGAGTYTITPTSFAQGTSFQLITNGACEMIWDGSNWFIVNDASAYITIT